MNQLDILKSAKSLHDVANTLGYKPKGMAYILYGQSEEAKYTDFEIPKRSGGIRKISAPNPRLSKLQKRLSDLLQDCISDINKDRNIKSAISHGFRRKHSIITNAAIHRRRRYVFNIDIENFFGVINFGRVCGFFIKNNNFQLDPAVATIIAKIACYNNALPQGSPCSPVISNLIGHTLDIKLLQLAYKNGCHYTRYADDLTFSTNKLDFPTELAEKIDEENDVWKPGKVLINTIENAGFSINNSKTRMQYKISRQDVTGLIVNNKVNVRSEYWRTARAMAHSLFNNGEFKIKNITKDETGKLITKEENGTLEQLNGILSFIDSLDHYNKIIINAVKRNDLRNLNSREEIYRKFLFYKDFYIPNLPLIVCEGKTDRIYIKEAIKKLYINFPQLAEKDAEGKINLKVKLYKYSKITDRLCKLGGGTGDLLNFIATYSSQRKAYKINGSKEPVIILIDNDEGSKKIFKYIKKHTDLEIVDGSSPYYYMIDNLYIIAIPKLHRNDTIIEDYFDKSVLKRKLRGKKFNPKVPFDKNIEYGKQIFAEQIIKKNADKINFDKFKIILDRIDKAILNYHKHD